MTDSPASAQPLGERGLLGEAADKHGAHGVERPDDAVVGERVAHAGALALGRDQAPLAEYLEMPRYRGLRHVESLGELADVLRTLGEGVEDEDALRVGQRLTDAGVQQVHFPFEAFVHYGASSLAWPVGVESQPLRSIVNSDIRLSGYTKILPPSGACVKRHEQWASLVPQTVPATSIPSGRHCVASPRAVSRPPQSGTPGPWARACLLYTSPS